MQKILVLLLVGILINLSVSAQDSLKSMNIDSRNVPWLAYRNSENDFYKLITQEALVLLDERKASIAEIEGKKEWRAYQETLKGRMFESLNRFKRTPLNAKVTGTLERAHFTVEKLVFESHPGFFVTAAIFIPKGLKKPAPAVLYCCGHTADGFRSTTYQHVIMNLVEKGFVVLSFDPISQGERLQYLDPQTGKSRIGGPTKEHSYAGVQCLLTGSSVSDIFIWDGVRAIDYLLSRKEVDPDRIGITGRSGGGTQSALIAAYDDRILAAAPECYLTTYERLLQSIGPQDAEQNQYAAIKNGFDHPDYLHLRAPKPTLMITTTHDFFSQQGAREVFAEGKKSFAALGKPEHLSMVEDMGNHESTQANREALYAFFQNYLDLPGNPEDLPSEPFSAQELQVSPSGQVGTSYPTETVFSLNQHYFKKQDLADSGLKEKAKELSGINLSRRMEAAVFTGKFRTGDYTVEKYILENERKDYGLPIYVAGNPSGVTEKIMLWLHPEGKQKVLDEDLYLPLLKDGYTIVCCDLLGMGELSDPAYRGDAIIQEIPFNFFFGAQLSGKSITTYQAESLDLVLQFLKGKFDLSQVELHATVQEEAVYPYLNYTLMKDPFSKTLFIHAPKSTGGLMSTEYYDPKQAYLTVPGSLPWYDLEDLYSLHTELFFLGEKDALGNLIPLKPGIGEVMKFLSESK